MIRKLRIDCTKLQIVPRKFLLHFKFGGVGRGQVLILGKYASLRGSLADKVLVVKNDAFEVVTAVVKFPQLLVDRSLVVQNGYDELFIDIFA